MLVCWNKNKEEPSGIQKLTLLLGHKFLWATDHFLRSQWIQIRIYTSGKKLKNRIKRLQISRCPGTFYKNIPLVFCGVIPQVAGSYLAASWRLQEALRNVLP